MAFWKKNDEDDLLREPSAAGPSRPIELPAKTPVAAPSPSASQATAVRSSLGPDTSITGKLSFSAPTRIDGKLKGEIRATELLIIGEQAVVEGAVRAQTLMLHGTVQGDVFGVERVEIVAGGRLQGSVQTPVLIVHEGAFLDGDCKIVPGPPAKPQPTTPEAATPVVKAGARI